MLHQHTHTHCNANEKKNFLCQYLSTNNNTLSTINHHHYPYGSYDQFIFFFFFGFSITTIVIHIVCTTHWTIILFLFYHYFCAISIISSKHQGRLMIIFCLIFCKDAFGIHNQIGHEFEEFALCMRVCVKRKKLFWPKKKLINKQNICDMIFI